MRRCTGVRQGKVNFGRAGVDVHAHLGVVYDGHISRRFEVSLADCGALFEQLHAKHDNKERVKIQLAPANLHWCSDAALAMLADYSERYDAPMHMHLVETAYQKEYARRRGGGTALDWLGDGIGTISTSCGPTPLRGIRQ